MSYPLRLRVPLAWGKGKIIMERLIFVWLDSGGTELEKYEQDVVTPELAGYALSRAIEAVKIALVAEDEKA